MNINKNVFLWSLYDFAVTPLVAATGGLFLAQWLVLDNHLPDIWYGGVFSLTTIVLLLTSPFFGAWSDQIGKRKPFLVISSICLLVAGVLLGITATSHLPSMTKIILVLFFFFVIQYTYQTGLVFYNSLLQTLSNSQTVGKISGIGQLFYNTGWLVIPFVLYPFATGKISLWGEPGRAQVFLPATIIFALCSLPMILWFREEKAKKPRAVIGLRTVCAKTVNGLVTLWKENKNVLLFLVAFMLVADALLTEALYFALYLDRLFHVSEMDKMLVVTVFGACLMLGAYFFGRWSDQYGTKKMLLVSCFILLSTFIAFGANNIFLLTYFFAAVFGIGHAGFWVTSRALLVKISPSSQSGEYFGFYSTFQKFASIFGPLTWGVITMSLNRHGTISYRVAVFALAIFTLVGTLLMMQVKEVVQKCK